MLEKFKKYFAKEATEDNNQTSDSVIKNWFENRYDSLIVQRNILFVFLLISVGVVILSIFAISYIATSKDFEPFVIQVQKDTGITTVVNPVSSQVLDGNDALARYFIKEYVSARETYNPVDFDTRSRTLIKLMSNPNIYSEYLGYISNDTNNPSVIYASNNTTYLKTKSWSKLSDGSFVYRFSVNETTGQKKIYSKIAIISFTYKAIELSEDQQDINPVGFTVTGYRVDDDNS
jgi:type IV secretion system protein VirB8